MLTALTDEQLNETTVGVFCGPDAYDHQYRRYCQYLVVKEAHDPLGSAAKGPVIENLVYCFFVYVLA